MRGADIGRQRRLVDGKTVVLARNQHPLRRQVLHRVVGAVVAELHLQRLRADRQTEDLVAEADTEQRHLRLEDLARRRDSVVARLRITGPVRQEYAVGIHGQDLGGGRRRRHHRDAAAEACERAQDVALDAEVVGDHVQTLRRVRQARLAAVPGEGLVPLVAALGRNDLRQVHALQAREHFRRADRRRRIGRLAGHDAAGLGALVAQDPRQAAGVEVGDRHDLAAHQEVAQRLGRPPAALEQRQVADHEAGSVDLRGLEILGVGAGIADVRVGQRDDLPAVGRIREDLLVAGHRRIEYHLAGCVALRPNRKTLENRSVF